VSDLRPYLKAVGSSSKLTVGDRLVLWTMAWYASDAGFAWPSSKTLEDDTGLSRDFVRRSLARIVKAGVLTCEHRQGRPTVYRFPIDHPALAELSTTRGQANTPTGPKPVFTRTHPAGKPVFARTQTCVQNGPNLCSGEHAEDRSYKEEETRASNDTVDNYGDRESAARMRQILEAARDETRQAIGR
jgi:hypothetical protein